MAIPKAQAGALAVLLSLALNGCAYKEPAPVTVNGRVEYDGGQPVANMVLIFYPMDDMRKHKILTFVSDGEGRFQDAVSPGRYKATLASLPMRSGEPAGGLDVTALQVGRVGVPPFMAPYRDREKSPWEIIIPITGMEDLLLTVK